MNHIKKIQNQNTNKTVVVSVVQRLSKLWAVSLRYSKGRYTWLWKAVGDQQEKKKSNNQKDLPYFIMFY